MTLLACERCGETEGVELEGSRTAYEPPTRDRFERVLDPEPEDPNAPVALCRPCAEDHHQYWTEMWNDYYRGCM